MPPGQRLETIFLPDMLVEFLQVCSLSSASLAWLHIDALAFQLPGFMRMLGPAAAAEGVCAPWTMPSRPSLLPDHACRGTARVHCHLALWCMVSDAALPSGQGVTGLIPLLQGRNMCQLGQCCCVDHCLMPDMLLQALASVQLAHVAWGGAISPCMLSSAAATPFQGKQGTTLMPRRLYAPQC